MELWGRKRPINGYGQRYELITYLNQENIYSETDKLDRTEYEECMVVDEGRCVFYREFDIPYVKRKEFKNGRMDLRTNTEK